MDRSKRYSPMPRLNDLLPAGVIVSEQPPGTPWESGISEQFRAGSHVAGYRLEQRIGLGGMAVVFRAYDSRLDRQVALKILAPALADDDAFRQRFIRESRAAAAVDDPHIIPVFEAGEADGVLFIAMRYVRGGDVRSLIDRIGPLPAGRAAEIISQAASALDAAHARGLVHRDVKPANMLLEASPAADRAEHLYLSDFGLSKAALATAGLTATGQFLGTLDYIAPEQIEGRPLDGRTDEYGLACSAFEMLCGDPPFRRADGGLSVMYAHLSERPPRLRLRRPELPAEVDEVLGKALAKSPDGRYPDCRQFAAALRQALGLGTGGPGRLADDHPATQIAMPVVTAADLNRETAVPPVVPPPAGRPPGKQQPALRPPAVRPRPVAALTEQGSLGPPGRPGQARGGLTDQSQAALAGTSAWPRVRRPWWRSRTPVAGVCAVALLAVGAVVLIGHGTSGGGSNARVAAITLPGCTSRTAHAKNLAGISSATVPVAGSPFGVAVTADDQYLFVSGDNSVTVLRNSAGAAPAVVRTISVHGVNKGDVLTASGKFLLAAVGSGAAIINVAEAVAGDPDPVFGTLTSKKGSGAVEVLITADDKFAFVTLQNSAEMAVFNLGQALSDGASPADFVGYVPLPTGPVGMATDGTWLYVASLEGFVTVVSLSRAESDEPHAVVASAPAGCQPARTLLSGNHQVVWVTDRGGNELLAFDAASLRSTPAHALIAKVMVGEAPIGATFTGHGTRIVVADSDLNNVAGQSPNLAIVSTTAALSGKPALLGYVPTGALPRQFALEPGGRTLLVTLQGERQLLAMTIAGLP